MYDYGARMLMPDLGRWGVMDAMSEKYTRWCPYKYAINNPVIVIDPDGNDAMFASGEAAQFAFKMYVATMSTGTGTSGGNGFTGFDNNRGKDPKPGFLGSIGRFFGNLFGGSKGAGIESYAPGAVISRTRGVVEIGEPIRIAEFFSTVSAASVAVGAATLGAVLTPTMMKDPEYNWTRDLDISLSGEISRGDNNRNGILLYRGISSSSHSETQAAMYNEALFGVAIPNGLRPGNIFRAHWDMDDYAMNDNISVWTSWTTNKQTARYFALGVGGKSDGVILSKRFKIGVNAIPNVSETGLKMQENEWLIFGPVIRANVEHVKP